MGGGNSGGGGSSGAVSYPAYMQTFHGLMLDSGGADTPTYSFMDLYNTATSGASPFSAAVAFDPSTNITNMDTALSTLQSHITAMAYATDWVLMLSHACSAVDASLMTDTRLTSEVDAYSDILDDELTVKNIPRFQGGMRDMGAVMTSAFTIGQALMEAFKLRDVAKFEADLYLKREDKRFDLVDSAVKTMMQALLQKADLRRAMAVASVEKERIAIVANKEESDMNVKYDEADAEWDLKCLQYGANMLASIGGGTATHSNVSRSQTASVMGGAMSGAAMGIAATAGLAAAGVAMPPLGIGAMIAGGAILGGGMSGGLF
jgi:hypothetical protein